MPSPRDTCVLAARLPVSIFPFDVPYRLLLKVLCMAMQAFSRMAYEKVETLYS